MADADDGWVTYLSTPANTPTPFMLSLSLLAPSVSFPLSPRFPRKDRGKGAERSGCSRHFLKRASAELQIGADGGRRSSLFLGCVQNQQRDPGISKAKGHMTTLHCRRGALVVSRVKVLPSACLGLFRLVGRVISRRWG